MKLTNRNHTLLDQYYKAKTNNDQEDVKKILAPIVFGRLRLGPGKIKASRLRTIKILLDSGSSESIITSGVLKNHKLKRTNDTQVWNTAAGAVETNQKVKVQFTLPEFYETTIIQHEMHVFKTKLNYDMIIGRDLLHTLGINLNFQELEISWNDASIPMKPTDCSFNNDFYPQDSERVIESTERIQSILDAKYEPANLKDIVEESKHLSETEQELLSQLLNKYKSIFDGTLGTWKDETLDIELKPNVSPYHARSYPVPKRYERTLKAEVRRLCKLGVLKKINHSEWAAPTFIIPKKDFTVRFISDFRELNKRIKRKPFPLPKIQDLMLKLEGFTYATSLDLNMGYYHIELTPDAKRLCTIVLPWGKYKYQILPMGLCNSQTYFKRKCLI